MQSFDQGSASGSASGSHRIIGSVSVQSIEALDAVLIVQLVHRRILRGGVEFCRHYC